MAELSEDLLEQAKHLVKREKKKPKQASVRRSVSAAYYALFHFLIEKTTSTLLGSQNDKSAARAWLGRAFEHGVMSTTCKFFGNQRATQFTNLGRQLGVVANPDLAAIANTFVNLQDFRHRADYDRSKSVSRADAQVAIAEVSDAFAKWKKIERKHSKLVAIFSAALLRGTKRQ